MNKCRWVSFSGCIERSVGHSNIFLHEISYFDQFIDSLLLLHLHLLLLPLLPPVAEPHLDRLWVDLELLCQLLRVLHVRGRIDLEVLVQSFDGLRREYCALLSSEMKILIVKVY